MHSPAMEPILALSFSEIFDWICRWHGVIGIGMYCLFIVFALFMAFADIIDNS